MFVLYVLVALWLASVAALGIYLLWPSGASSLIVPDDPWIEEIGPMIRVSDHVTISSTLVPGPNVAQFQNGLIFAPIRNRPWAVAQNHGI